jgi:hypothetical protein
MAVFPYPVEQISNIMFVRYGRHSPAMVRRPEVVSIDGEEDLWQSQSW